MWMLPSIPTLEEYDREELAKGTNFALYKFFNTHIILPMVAAIRHYEAALPPELEVQIEHPSIPELKSLGMRWYAIPAISNFSVHIGGINYGCIPFNGWYMGTEIMRDFLDEYRYNMMEEIAKVLKLDTSSEQTLWRDRVWNSTLLSSTPSRKRR